MCVKPGFAKDCCGHDILVTRDECIDITLANLSILKTGKARAIRFSTLEAICGALGCQPGDILEFVSESISGAEQLRKAS